MIIHQVEDEGCFVIITAINIIEHSIVLALQTHRGTLLCLSYKPYRCKT